MGEWMRIGELAERTSVSVRAIRYYETQDLIHPERTESGQRVFPEAAVERVRTIQDLYAAGLPSRTVVDLLPCLDTGLATEAMLDRMQEERRTIADRIARLLSAADRLDGVIAGVQRRGVVDDGPVALPSRARERSNTTARESWT